MLDTHPLHTPAYVTLDLTQELAGQLAAQKPQNVLRRETRTSVFHQTGIQSGQGWPVLEQHIRGILRLIRDPVIVLPAEFFAHERIELPG